MPDKKQEPKVWITVQVPASMAAALEKIVSADGETDRSKIVRGAIKREIETRSKNVSKAGK